MASKEADIRVPMTSLRQRQKANRRREIINAARRHFLEHGFEAATMEAIAADAGLSAMTVYNYYGTKTGLLLALVSESDNLLVEQIEGLIEDPPRDLLDAVLTFARTIRVHALRYLTKPIWRQVVAASIIEGDSEFGQVYAALDRKLMELMGEMLRRQQEMAAVPRHLDCRAAGESLFLLQNARFIQFISSEELSSEETDELLAIDIMGMLTLSTTTNRKKSSPTNSLT